MRSLVILQQRRARVAAKTRGENPHRRNLLASEVASQGADSEITALPIDYQRSQSVQNASGQFLWLAGYDGL